MDTTRIRLDLNREQREVVASILFGEHDTYLIVYGIALRTAHGQKTHRGHIWLKAQQPGHVYSAKDIAEAGYAGMLGNGSGTRSRFRYIGFCPAN